MGHEMHRNSLEVNGFISEGEMGFKTISRMDVTPEPDSQNSNSMTRLSRTYEMHRNFYQRRRDRTAAGP
jgi:hypothetical protein